MTGIILLTGQLGVVIGGFIGMSAMMTWYHKGGDKHGSSNSKISRSNN